MFFYLANCQTNCVIALHALSLFREFQSTKELHDSAVILLKANFIKATQISKPRYKKFLCLKINTA